MGRQARPLVFPSRSPGGCQRGCEALETGEAGEADHPLIGDPLIHPPAEYISCRRSLIVGETESLIAEWDQRLEAEGLGVIGGYTSSLTGDDYSLSGDGSGRTIWMPGYDWQAMIEAREVLRPLIARIPTHSQEAVSVWLEHPCERRAEQAARIGISQPAYTTLLQSALDALSWAARQDPWCSPPECLRAVREAVRAWKRPRGTSPSAWERRTALLPEAVRHYVRTWSGRAAAMEVGIPQPTVHGWLRRVGDGSWVTTPEVQHTVSALLSRGLRRPVGASSRRCRRRPT